jgi:Rrf2 family protein
MRISSKGRYALAAVACIGENFESDEHISVLAISERLGISKLYLEQVFALLRRGKIVISVKGTQGGYKLSKSPKIMTAYDVLAVVELVMFEKTESSVKEKCPEIDGALTECVFDVLDRNVITTLKNITIKNILENARNRDNEQIMYYI